MLENLLYNSEKNACNTAELSLSLYLIVVVIVDTMATNLHINEYINTLNLNPRIYYPTKLHFSYNHENWAPQK